MDGLVLRLCKDTKKNIRSHTNSKNVFLNKKRIMIENINDLNIT